VNCRHRELSDEPAGVEVVPVGEGRGPDAATSLPAALLAPSMIGKARLEAAVLEPE
jgi:hypothetical protein